MDDDTSRDDRRLNLHDESGMTRRDLMRRGAIVGGTLLWVAPAIQSFSSKAYAQDGGPSPLCEFCIAGSTPGGPPTHATLGPTTACCDCVEAAPTLIDAIIDCSGAGGDCHVIEAGPGPCPA